MPGVKKKMVWDQVRQVRINNTTFDKHQQLNSH